MDLNKDLDDRGVEPIDGPEVDQNSNDSCSHVENDVQSDEQDDEKHGTHQNEPNEVNSYPVFEDISSEDEDKVKNKDAIDGQKDKKVGKNQAAKQKQNNGENTDKNVNQAKKSIKKGNKNKNKEEKSSNSNDAKSTNEKGIYEVEHIKGKKFNSKTKRLEYYVFWKGYSDKEATWEPTDNLIKCDEILEKYEEDLANGEVELYEGSDDEVEEEEEQKEVEEEMEEEMEEESTPNESSSEEEWSISDTKGKRKKTTNLKKRKKSKSKPCKESKDTSDGKQKLNKRSNASSSDNSKANNNGKSTKSKTNPKSNTNYKSKPFVSSSSSSSSEDEVKLEIPRLITIAHRKQGFDYSPEPVKVKSTESKSKSNEFLIQSGSASSENKKSKSVERSSKHVTKSKSANPSKREFEDDGDSSEPYNVYTSAKGCQCISAKKKPRSSSKPSRSDLIKAQDEREHSKNEITSYKNVDPTLCKPSTSSDFRGSSMIKNDLSIYDYKEEDFSNDNSKKSKLVTKYGKSITDDNKKFKFKLKKKEKNSNFELKTSSESSKLDKHAKTLNSQLTSNANISGEDKTKADAKSCKPSTSNANTEVKVHKSTLKKTGLSDHEAKNQSKNKNHTTMKSTDFYKPKPSTSANKESIAKQEYKESKESKTNKSIMKSTNDKRKHLEFDKSEKNKKSVDQMKLKSSEKHQQDKHEQADLAKQQEKDVKTDDKSKKRKEKHANSKEHSSQSISDVKTNLSESQLKKLKLVEKDKSVKCSDSAEHRPSSSNDQAKIDKKQNKEIEKTKEDKHKDSDHHKKKIVSDEVDLTLERPKHKHKSKKRDKHDKHRHSGHDSKRTSGDGAELSTDKRKDKKEKSTKAKVVSKSFDASDQPKPSTSRDYFCEKLDEKPPGPSTMKSKNVKVDKSNSTNAPKATTNVAIPKHADASRSDAAVLKESKSGDSVSEKNDISKETTTGNQPTVDIEKTSSGSQANQAPVESLSTNSSEQMSNLPSTSGAKVEKTDGTKGDQKASNQSQSSTTEAAEPWDWHREPWPKNSLQGKLINMLLPAHMRYHLYNINPENVRDDPDLFDD